MTQTQFAWLGNARDVIQNRRSVRGFSGEVVTESQKNKMRTALDSGRNPFRSAHRFDFVSRAENEDVKLGTYGVIKGAKDYLVSAMFQGPESLEALGFDMEYAVLEAESLGLGTCWLGGTFNKGQFAQAIQLKSEEILPIVIPVGKPAPKDGLLGRFIRNVAGSNDRKAFDQIFYEEDFAKGLSIERSEDAYDALEAVRLAPSASNKQPWRVVKRGNRFDFYLAHTKGYAEKLSYDIQRVDLGIAVCHFDVVMLSKGISGQWLKHDDAEIQSEEMSYIISWTNVK